MKKEIVERFLKYVGFDTQSSEEAEGRCPSTEKQLRLAEYLVEELRCCRTQPKKNAVIITKSLLFIVNSCILPQSIFIHS